MVATKSTAARAARAHRRFPWRWQQVTVAGQTVSLATPADTDQILVDACKSEQTAPRRDADVSDPFWAQVWRSTEALDAYLCGRDLSRVSTLELGCGTGAGGLAAALRGADVTFTDGATEPLLLLRVTLDRLRAEYRCPTSRLSVRRLRFGIDAVPGARFRLIIASDITYLRANWEGIDRTLWRHLADGGEVLLGDPFRSVSTEFCQWAQRRGWAVGQHRIDLPDTPIRIIRLTAASRGLSDAGSALAGLSHASARDDRSVPPV
jgi:predicted nicotinamide N-methyase